MSIINAKITRLHQLAWRPGAFMHSQWWFSLQLLAWRPYYWCDQSAEGEAIEELCQAANGELNFQQRQDPLRQALDQLICQKRCFPLAPLPAILSADQQQLLALESRLGKLLVAVGLQLLGSPDYLLRGHYRRVLAPLLGWQALDQLWALWRQGDQPAQLPVEKLVVQAQQCAYQVINSYLTDDPVWQALSVILPPPLPASAPAAVSPDNPLIFLFRVARFL
jgi:Type III secretion system subunit